MGRRNVAPRKDPVSTDKKHARVVRGVDVAIFITSMAGGGAERVMRDLANSFAQRGIQTHLVLARAEGPYLADLDPQVRVVDCSARRPIFALPRLVRYLRAERPSSVLSALVHTNLIAVAARALSRVPTRLVVSQRTDASVKPDLRREPLEMLNYWLLGFGYRRADAVTAVSKGVARSLVRSHHVPPDMIHVIYNPVEVPASTTNHASHSWLQERGVSLILGAGRLTRAKGFDVLLRSFRLVLDSRPARLAILGVGEDERLLRCLIQELDLEKSVQLVGFVPDPWLWMRQADVFVLSSRWEGLPGVLLQAMACGTPVVSTDCPSGPDEILENGKWGKLVPVENPQAMADAIIETLESPNNPPVAERAAQFDLTSSVNAYLEVLGILNDKEPN